MKEKFYIVDTHSDFITKYHSFIRDGAGEFQWSYNDAKEAGVGVQVFGICTGWTHYEVDPLFKTIEVIDTLYKFCSDFNCNLIRSNDDIEKSRKEGNLGVILALENSSPLKGSVGVLNVLYKLGLRMLSFTWNYRNELADGIAVESRGGLTSLGKTVLKEAERLGIIIDISHLNEVGFWDVIENSTMPVIASHSNVFKLKSVSRNLNDRQIDAIAEKNGVIGVTFVPDFLGDEEVTIDTLYRHIDYIGSRVGIDYVGLGSDFDGITNTPKGLDGVKDIWKVGEYLLKKGYKEEDVEKVMGDNSLRVIREILKG